MLGLTDVENHIIREYLPNSQLSKSLILIREVMESIWTNDAPRIVQNFTDHGIEHSERIVEFVEKLLKANMGTKFSQQEIYLLLAGIYLHDIGMQCDIVKYPEVKKKAEKLGAKFNEAFSANETSGYSLEEQKEIRENHHYLSAAWIDYLHEGNDPVLSHGIKSVPYDLVDDLIDVCKFHSKLSINDCSDLFKDYPNSRKKMVAALLRFGDELDISSTRVKIETVKIFAINPENGVYWWLHNYTKINFVDYNKIHFKVNLHPEDFNLYGSFIRNDYVSKFKSKNQPVLDILVGQKIPVVIDNNSDIVAHNRAEKFPPEIAGVLNKRIQKDEIESNVDIHEIVDLKQRELSDELSKEKTNDFNRKIQDLPSNNNSQRKCFISGYKAPNTQSQAFSPIVIPQIKQNNMPNKKDIIVDLISLFEKRKLYGLSMSHHEATDHAINVYKKVPERISDFKKLFSFATENNVSLLGFTLNMPVSDAIKFAIRTIEEITSDQIDEFIDLVSYTGKMPSLGLGLSQSDSIEVSMKVCKDVPIERVSEFKDLVSFATGRGFNLSRSTLNMSTFDAIEFAVRTIKEVPSDMINEFKNLILSAKGQPFAFNSSPSMTTPEAIDYARRTITELM